MNSLKSFFWATLATAGGLTLLATAWARADDLEVEIELDDDEVEVEVDDDDPDVNYVPRVRIYKEPAGTPRVSATVVQPSVTYRAPAVTYRRPVESDWVYGYVEPREESVSTRHDSLWYGDSYTDDWMYSLKSYNLRDDYRLYSQAAPAQTDQILGYVGEDEPEAEAVRMQRRVTGQVRELRLMDLDEPGPPQLMAVLLTDDDLLRRVLLGPVNQAEVLGLEIGERITAAGEPRIVEGVSVLVATRVQLETQRGTTVRRTPAANWYHGIIVGTRRVQRLGESEPYLIATVRLDDGTTAPFDLGPAANLPPSMIQPDNRVTIVGRTERLPGNATIVVADLLQSTGSTVQIHR